MKNLVENMVNPMDMVAERLAKRGSNDVWVARRVSLETRWSGARAHMPQRLWKNNYYKYAGNDHKAHIWEGPDP